ncbi:MAG: PEP-CTERM sorting domain-containing protein [Aquabacterium sp.]
MFHSFAPRSVAFAAALLLAAAGAQAKGALGGANVLSGKAGGPVALAGFTDYSFNVAGIFSNEGLGNALNEVHNLIVGANAHVIGIGWDVTIFADSPSWLSEMVVNFGSTSTGFVNLTVGIGDDAPGTQSYSSGGVIDIVGLALDFNVDADGKLRMEFFESFNDFAGDWDGRWLSGALNIRVEGVVPEPSTYALMGLGLAGVAAWARRRSQKQA